MLYSVLRLRGERMVVALVERWQLERHHAAGLVSHLQSRFHLPAMLIARDDSDWRNAKAYADFDVTRYLFEILTLDEIDWNELQ
jgi:hypothetical protein